MRKASLTVVMCVLVWAGTALATPMPQQNCDYARITAWKVYTSCVDTVVAKDAKGVSFDESAAFAKCRHTYFKNWEKFQTKASLTGSTCVGSRFVSTDSGTTVTDNLTGLVWELKTTDGSIHDTHNTYRWGTGTPIGEYYGNDTVFGTFLTGLNDPGFADAKDWRVPTLTELQTIISDFPCTGAFGSSKCLCPTNPCAAIDSVIMTGTATWWSGTSYFPAPYDVWGVNFINADVYGNYTLNNSFWVRAARGGL